MKLRILSIVGTAVLALAGSPAANAIDTLIQFSSDGTGTGSDGSYDITGINEFDWQSSGDLTIVDDLTGSGSIAGGTLYDSFALWAANATVGDFVTFDAHTHARLNDMLDNGGASIAPSNLSTDGGVTGDFEITAAASFTETAFLAAPGTLVFVGASGSYAYFYDSTPDSDVGTGGGFVDGVAFISGSVINATGSFTAGSGGSSFITNSVTSYLTAYVQTDPDSNAPLSETTYDTLISFISSGEASTNGLIGLLPYTLSLADLVFKADANTEFGANPVPEPTVLALLSIGLLGMAGIRRRRNA